MHAVEAADQRPRAGVALELSGCVDDLHASLASASSGGMIRSGSASSTRERADLGSPQGDAVPAERVCDRADVRPRRDEQVEPRDTVRVTVELELVNVHRAHRHLDRDAAAVERVRALAVDLHGGGRRDRQVDRAT